MDILSQLRPLAFTGCLTRISEILMKDIFLVYKELTTSEVLQSAGTRTLHVELRKNNGGNSYMPKIMLYFL